MPEDKANKNKNLTFTALTSKQYSSGGLTPKEKSTNISKGNLAVLKDIAKSNNVAMILRPVNKSALPLINNGAVGKNIFAHGKSSEYPTVNGLIPMHSAISKAGKNDDLTRINKYDEENDHSVENSDEVLGRVEKKIKSKWSELSPKEKEDPEKYHDKILAKAGLSAELFEELVQPVD